MRRKCRISACWTKSPREAAKSDRRLQTPRHWPKSHGVASGAIAKRATSDLGQRLRVCGVRQCYNFAPQGTALPDLGEPRAHPSIIRKRTRGEPHTRCCRIVTFRPSSVVCSVAFYFCGGGKQQTKTECTIVHQYNFEERALSKPGAGRAIRIFLRKENVSFY